MAVFIYDADVFEKLVAVEGELYRRQGQRDMMGHCSLDAFQEEWEAGYSHWRGTDQSYPYLDVKGGAAIYGQDGYNRYLVQANGELIFLTSLAGTPEDITRAMKVGFTLG